MKKVSEIKKENERKFLLSKHIEDFILAKVIVLELIVQVPLTKILKWVSLVLCSHTTIGLPLSTPLFFLYGKTAWNLWNKSLRVNCAPNKNVDNRYAYRKYKYDPRHNNIPTFPLLLVYHTYARARLCAYSVSENETSVTVFFF